MHAILFSDVAATDGLDDLPLKCVSVVGLADDDVAAIDQVSAHFAAHPDLATRFRDGSWTPVPNAGSAKERSLKNQLWFLRGAGAKGDEIHAGYGDTTLYRIVEL